MMYSEYPVESAAGALLKRVFGWMTLGLSLTGLVALAINQVPGMQLALAKSPGLMLVLILLQLGVVLFLSFGIQRMSKEAAMASYVFYSLLTGVVLSTLFLVYTSASLAMTFFVCAAMFGAMAIYGSVTKADLSGMGSFLFMGVIGLIVAGLINMFVRSAQFDFITSIFGVIIFTLFTAYDVNKIKQLGTHLLGEGDEITKVSIIAALQLYLDFINIFLYLLRFLGQRKDS